MGRSLVLLNAMGDLEITWDAESDAQMRALIDKKMREGVVFFQVERGFMGLLPKKQKIRTVSDLDANKVRVSDADVAALFADGKVNFTRREGGALQTLKRLFTADEVVATPSVGIPQFKGG